MRQLFYCLFVGRSDASSELVRGIIMNNELKRGGDGSRCTMAVQLRLLSLKPTVSGQAPRSIMVKRHDKKMNCGCIIQ